jgi:Helix-turn-helix domain
MSAVGAGRLDNPLRRLRNIISQTDRAMRQADLAKRIHFSVATLRAIENGRRPLSERCLFSVWVWLGLRWDGEEWHQDR